MSDSLSLKTSLVLTPASGVEFNPMGDDIQDDVSIDETTGKIILTAATGGGTAIPATFFTTCNAVIVKNLDPTNFVTLSWSDSVPSAANQQKIAAGRSMTIPDVDPSATWKLVADAAGCKCELIATGA